MPTICRVLIHRLGDSLNELAHGLDGGVGFFESSWRMRWNARTPVLFVVKQLANRRDDEFKASHGGDDDQY